MDPNGGIYRGPDDESKLSDEVKAVFKEDQARLDGFLTGKADRPNQADAWERRLQELQTRAHSRNTGRR